MVLMVQKLARGYLGFLPHMSEVVWGCDFLARVRIFYDESFHRSGYIAVAMKSVAVISRP